MEPLLRHASRSAFDSMFMFGAPRATRQLSTRSAIRVSKCIQCRAQKRHFADDNQSKSTTPASPAPALAPAPFSFPNDGSNKSQPELPSARERRSSATAKRFSTLMDTLQGNIFLASQRLNDLTGYSGIEALKKQITVLESHLSDCQEAVRAARVTYKTTIADRAASQREVTGLLARKDTWTPIDLERFTALYRSDHGNEQAVQEAAARLAECERNAEQAAQKLSSSILSRYHEEQIWSDKIRRMSTWGTWGLMGVNVLLFLVFQFGFEPWRRARLVKGFEEKVREALDKERLNQAGTTSMAAGKSANGATVHVEADEGMLDGVVTAGLEELQDEMGDDPKNADPAVDALATVIRSDVVGTDETETKVPENPVPMGSFKRPETWKPVLLDLFSDRVISLRKQDVTIIALESAATSAAFVAFMALFVLRPN